MKSKTIQLNPLGRSDTSSNSSGGGFPFIQVVSILILAGLGIRLYIAWQDFTLLFQKCVVDDALFYLNIAKNISLGNGATFDGSILTNGFHPVYALCLVPIFLLFPNSPDLTFHLGLTILSLFNVLTGVFIYMAVRELAGKFAALVATFIWIFNPYVIFISLNGVEVSVACFFLSLSAYRFIVMRKKRDFTAKNLLILGALTGLAILSRIDSVFMLGAFTLFIFYDTYLNGKRFISALSQSSLFNLAAFTVMAPWFLWNLYHFGTIRQISGVTLPNIAHNMYLMQNNTYLSLSLIKTELFYLKIWLENIILYSGGWPLILITILIFFLVSGKSLLENSKELLHKTKKIDFLFLSSTILVMFYALYFWGWHRPWYYLSAMLTVTIFLGVVTGEIQRIVSSSHAVSRRITILGIALFVVLASYFLYTGGKAWEKGLFPFQAELYESAVWINENTEKDTKIGAISSGVYGYITQRTTDLLGVVNAEAYRAVDEKRFFSYLKEKELDYLVDREDMVMFFSKRFDEHGFMDKLTIIKRFGEKSDNVVVYKISYD